MTTEPIPRWPDDHAELVARLATAPEPVLHAWMCDCAEHAIESCAPLAASTDLFLPDDAPIEVKRRWLAGEATTEELEQAQREAVWGCYWGHHLPLGAAVLGCAWYPGSGLALAEDEQYAESMTWYRSAFEAACDVLRECTKAVAQLAHRAAWSAEDTRPADAASRRAWDEESAWQASHVLGERPPVWTGPALDGTLARAGHDDADDDGWLHPALGIGVVARGLGAIGHQGRPAAKLAVWSVVGELVCAAEATLEPRLLRGLSRAEQAVQRLTANWPEGLVRCSATLAAVVLDGSTALVVHVGDCGVARLVGGRIVPLTVPHTLGAELPEAPAAIAGAPTRAVGRGGVPEIQRIPVQPGDVLLLSTTLWPAELAAHGTDPDALATELARRGGGTVIAAQVGDRTTRPLARGSSRPPALPWLYRPGEPLADPPARYAGAPGHGPDAQWFAEVFAGVVTDGP